MRRTKSGDFEGFNFGPAVDKDLAEGPHWEVLEQLCCSPLMLSRTQRPTTMAYRGVHGQPAMAVNGQSPGRALLQRQQGQTAARRT